jgi:hypothetical protein
MARKIPASEDAGYNNSRQIVIERHGRFLNLSDPARRAKSSALI